MGQTFTAVHTGTVIRAQVEIDRLVAGGDFQLQILATDGAGTPVNGIIGSATIADSSLPLGPTMLKSSKATAAGAGQVKVTLRPAKSAKALLAEKASSR